MQVDERLFEPTSKQPRALSCLALVKQSMQSRVLARAQLKINQSRRVRLIANKLKIDCAPHRQQGRVLARHWHQDACIAKGHGSSE